MSRYRLAYLAPKDGFRPRKLLRIEMQSYDLAQLLSRTATLAKRDKIYPGDPETVVLLEPSYEPLEYNRKMFDLAVSISPKPAPITRPVVCLVEPLESPSWNSSNLSYYFLRWAVDKDERQDAALCFKDHERWSAYCFRPGKWSFSTALDSNGKYIMD